ncbi:hypothetical protein ACFSTC_57140 [Nonomuraea ferruginea]
MAEDDRTRAMRSPGERRPLPSSKDGPRAAGAPAHHFPQPPPQPVADDVPRSSSRVYGKRRSGSSPVRPMRSTSDRPPPRRPDNGRRAERIKGGTVLKILLALLVALVVTAAGMLFWIDGRLGGLPAGILDDYEGRPADTPPAPTGSWSAPTAARACRPASAGSSPPATARASAPTR